MNYNVHIANEKRIEQEGKRDVDIRPRYICVDSGVYMLENHAENTARIISVLSGVCNFSV